MGGTGGRGGERWAASLPMYDFPEMRPHVDRLWEALRDGMRRRGLRGVPDTLTHLGDEWDAHWTSSSIYFSQVCGVEVVKRFAGRYRVLATPRLAAPGCTGHNYRSFVVVRDNSPYRQLEELRGARLAVNSFYSHSGSTSLLPLVAPLSRDGRFFGEGRVTGSHERSLSAVRGGEAEVAAVDCVTYHLLARYRPSDVRGVRVIAETPPAPAPPYVAPASQDPSAHDAMRAALVEAFSDPALEKTRGALFLAGLEQTDEDAYAPILEFLEAGARHGYGELRDAYRLPVRVPVALSLASATALAGQTLNVSRSGAFVALAHLPRSRCGAAAELPPVGSAMSLDITVDDPPETLRMYGLVVRHDEKHGVPGVGLRFVDLSEKQTRTLDALLARARD